MKPGDLVRIVDYGAQPEDRRLGVLTRIRGDTPRYEYEVLVEGELICYNVYHIVKVDTEDEEG